MCLFCFFSSIFILSPESNLSAYAFDKLMFVLRKKNKAIIVHLKTEPFDNIDSAVIVSSVSKAEQN